MIPYFQRCNKSLSMTFELGTPLYMAPEIKKKHFAGQKYDNKIDIYALGIILFEMIQPMKTLHEKNKLIDDVT